MRMHPLLAIGLVFLVCGLLVSVVIAPVSTGDDDDDSDTKPDGDTETTYKDDFDDNDDTGDDDGNDATFSMSLYYQDVHGEQVYYQPFSFITTSGTSIAIVQIVAYWTISGGTDIDWNTLDVSVQLCIYDTGILVYDNSHQATTTDGDWTDSVDLHDILDTTKQENDLQITVDISATALDVYGTPVESSITYEHASRLVFDTTSSAFSLSGNVETTGDGSTFSAFSVGGNLNLITNPALLLVMAGFIVSAVGVYGAINKSSGGDW